ncbi:hypothetical protein GUITHDRAFT_113167 [Guillardia theta CCMP2712]|uniref:Uncharacterized protein n=1 Tax=Guillardia theta (strain CCMP2712) TaxID=905079 RepID=L1IXM2_GUITC|nr:hypothetical protein GUITHDRAFT_113167 [Guillardia theta CCMP2712]EKX40634.1 hypothetical protein GUITHDRAFT_113167 [Guillardia theta CCMP2712]|eukprot:XP_005827614.1 hypothetical protein GUITHDRAFT_113167 [Guillardia theta CCMP2712]
MKGDIHIPGIRDRGSKQYEGLMADVTLVHPYIGSSADLTKWGEVNLDALHGPPFHWIKLNLLAHSAQRQAAQSHTKHKPEKNLSGARRMTPLRAQALLEPEDSSSSDFVESPEEESSPEVSDSDGGNPSSGADDRRGAGEAPSPSLTVTSGASGELDTTGVLAACPSGACFLPGIGRVPPVLGHCCDEMDCGVAAVTGGVGLGFC